MVGGLSIGTEDRYKWMALSNTTMAVFMSALDGSIVLIALPAIFRGIHLDPLAQEALAFHIHQHLDVYVNDKHVTVPALIGIYANSFITEMHTHTPDGVLHVESPKNQPYVLGQIFGEWGVRLNASCLGRYCGDLHWWLNGKPQAGNPADLIVHAHQEIVIAAGKPPAHIPASYNFPAGE